MKVLPTNDRLRTGIQAPEFVGMTPEGAKVKLADFPDQRVWLMFYRYAGCPLCNLHLLELSLWLDVMQAENLAIVAVFESEPEAFPRVRRWEGSVPLIMLSDPRKRLYSLYGVEARNSAAFRPQVLFSWLRARVKGFRQGPVTGALGQVPGHFLIDERGIIERLHYGRHIDDHIAWSDVEGFLAKRPALAKAR